MRFYIFLYPDITLQRCTLFPISYKNNGSIKNKNQSIPLLYHQKLFNLIKKKRIYCFLNGKFPLFTFNSPFFAISF